MSEPSRRSGAKVRLCAKQLCTMDFGKIVEAFAGTQSGIRSSRHVPSYPLPFVELTLSAQLGLMLEGSALYEQLTGYT
jgi:hypothetical protein